MRTLTIVDEFTRECLAIDVARKLTSEDVWERLPISAVPLGVSSPRSGSGNGSSLSGWRRSTSSPDRLGRVGAWRASTASCWMMRDALLARNVFDTLLKAKVLIERWRKAYNKVRPHNSLGCRPPAPESRRPCLLGSAAAQQAARGDPLAGLPR